MLENEVIRQIKELSQQSERRFSFLATYIQDNWELIPHLTINELAKNAYTSPATVNRFCKYLQLDGYKELIHTIKYFLNTSLNPETDDVHEDDSQLFFNMVYNKYTNVIKSLHNTFRLLMRQQVTLSAVVSEILTARKINVFAVGGTYTVAQDFIEKLLRIGFHILSANNYHTGFFLAKNTSANDLNIFISYSGETEDLIKLAKIVREKNSRILVVSKHVNNSLIRLAKYKLTIDSEEKTLRTSSQTSRFALLFALDTIYSWVIQSDTDYYNKILKATTIEKF